MLDEENFCINCAADEGLEYESFCMLGEQLVPDIPWVVCSFPQTYRELQIIAEARGLQNGNTPSTK